MTECYLDTILPDIREHVYFYGPRFACWYHVICWYNDYQVRVHCIYWDNILSAKSWIHNGIKSVVLLNTFIPESILYVSSFSCSYYLRSFLVPKGW